MTSTDSLLRKINHQDGKTYSSQIDKYGKSYIDYKNHYVAAGKHEYTPTFPLHIHFEQTFTCNLRCPSCLQGYQHEKAKYNTGVSLMPFEIFEKVIFECQKNQCPSIALHTNDEPLLVNDITKRISFAKQHGVMDIFMTTNAQLLTKELATDICEAGLTHILFSIDAATTETYAHVRVKGKFQKVLNAISFINAWKEANHSELPVTRASFVVNKNNYFEEELFVNKFKNMVDYIDIQSFYALGELTRMLAPPGYRQINLDTFICAEPFRKVIVRANGDIAPCCSPYGYRQIVGNIKSQTISEIFNGKKMKQLRQSLYDRRFLNICSECVSNLYEKTIR